MDFDSEFDLNFAQNDNKPIIYNHFELEFDKDPIEHPDTVAWFMQKYIQEENPTKLNIESFYTYCSQEYSSIFKPNVHLSSTRYEKFSKIAME